MTEPVTDTLVFVRWYAKKAVYRDGKLVYFGEGDVNRGILRALGFEWDEWPDVPATDIPPEFDRDEKTGWWVPPATLAVLKAQYARYQARSLREDIDRAEKHLADLYKRARDERNKGRTDDDDQSEAPGLVPR